MKRIIALILLVFSSVLMLCNCSDRSYSWGSSSVGFEFAHYFNAKIKSDTLDHPKNDVVLDLYISKYQYEYEEYPSGETVPTYRMAIYVSNSEAPPFKRGDTYNLNSLDRVNGARLLRLISYDEVFYTDFGFFSNFLLIEYDHKEKIYIPEEFFNQDNDRVYVHVVELNVTDNGKGGYTVSLTAHTKVELIYTLMGDYIRL